MTSSDKGGVSVSTEDRPPSLVVIEAVAALTDTQPSNCPTLHDYVDPEALNHIFDGRDGGTVCFQYHGCEITVDDNRAITVEQK